MRRAKDLLLAGVLMVLLLASLVYLDRIGKVPLPPPFHAEPTPSTTVEPSATARPSAKPSPTASAATTQPVGVPKHPKNAWQMKVTYVYDGDTIQAVMLKPNTIVTTDQAIRIRLVGVDAPELTPKAECHAKQAHADLRALLPTGSIIWVAPDKDTWDDYGRRLFHVWTAKDVFVDHQLVLQGSGRAIAVHPNITYEKLMLAAEETANRQRKGLWKSCR